MKLTPEVQIHNQFSEQSTQKQYYSKIDNYNNAQECIFCNQDRKNDNSCIYVLKNKIIENLIETYLKVFYYETFQQISQFQETQLLQLHKQLQYLPNKIQHSLFKKYSQSQNYYYTRDINDILNENITAETVKFNDYVLLDNQEEFLKRFYYLDEYSQKVDLLAEYYKFHTDISRLFMEPQTNVLNKYYDKKRKLDYYRIAKLIEEDNKNNPDQPPKGIVGEKPSPINTLEADDDDEEQRNKQWLQNLKETIILKDLSFVNRSYNNSQKENQVKKKDKSQTLQEICRNLDNYIEQRSILDQSQSSVFQIQLQQVEKQKLNKFLKYVKLNQQQYQNAPQTKENNKQILKKPPNLKIEQLKTDNVRSQSIEKQSSSRKNSTHQDRMMINELQQMKLNLKLRAEMLKKKFSQEFCFSKNSSKCITPVLRSFEQEFSEKPIQNFVRKIKNDIQKKKITQNEQINVKQQTNKISQQLQQNQPSSLNKLLNTNNNFNKQEMNFIRKTGAKTHRPQTNSLVCKQVLSRDIKQQTRQNSDYQKQKGKLILDLKKLCLEDLEQSQSIKQPLSNRSNQQQRNILNNGWLKTRTNTQNSHNKKQSDRIININININENENKTQFSQQLNQSHHKLINSLQGPVYIKDQYLPGQGLVLSQDSRTQHPQSSEFSGSKTDRNIYGKIMDFIQKKNQSAHCSPNEKKQSKLDEQRNIYLQATLNQKKVKNQSTQKIKQRQKSLSNAKEKAKTDEIKQKIMREWAMEQIKQSRKLKKQLAKTKTEK